eukprot:COSAG02_NODE_3056_length_7455_cov_5.333469_5_plen_177_part_00
MRRCDTENTERERERELNSPLTDELAGWLPGASLLAAALTSAGRRRCASVVSLSRPAPGACSPPRATRASHLRTTHGAIAHAAERASARVAQLTPHSRRQNPLSSNRRTLVPVIQVIAPAGPQAGTEHLVNNFRHTSKAISRSHSTAWKVGECLMECLMECLLAKAKRKVECQPAF